MPNYSLVSNALFQPFTYQELAAPLDRQELYHEKLAEEYDKLSSQADVLEAMGQNDKDKKSGAYSRYKAYSDNLRKEADALYRFGLNTESRQRLSDMRRLYNTEIVPIQNAWQKREQESAEQMKAQLQNPSLMFTRDARSTGLDDYVRNPQGGYGVINGANITAQMAGMAKNLEKQIRQGDTTLESIDPYTYNYIRKYGLDANMIRDWRNNPTLKKMFEQVMEANGVTPEALEGSLNAQNIIDKSTGYAEMGMWSAIGEDKSQVIDNYGARLEAQMEKELAVAQAKAAAAGGGSGDAGFPKLKATNIGVESAEAYSAAGMEELSKLKAGNDGLKSSYFGNKAGQVNPMTIYKEYQEERKKHTKQVKRAQDVNNPYAPSPQKVNVATTVPDDAAAKKAVLSKYAKYGVTEILNDKQYELLSGMGYNEKNNPSTGRARHSTLVGGFNNLMKQKTAYDIPMADGAYKEMDASLTAGLIQNKKSLASKVYEYDGYKKGKGVSSLSDLGVDEKDPSKSAKILTIGYDPNHKGFVRVTYNNGKVFLMKPELIGGAGMAQQLSNYENNKYTNRVTGESRMLTPEEITSGLARNINWYNPGRQSTSSDAF